MSQNLKVVQQEGETPAQTMARVSMTPENLSATALSVCQTMGDVPITEMAQELRRQTEALAQGDMSRAEEMLLAQAHTLDGLFAKLTTRAFGAKDFQRLEGYLRLALKAQGQARATLQTLGELKSPKQVAFVRQANISNQVQVNNGTTDHRACARKSNNEQNQLLEVDHEQRMDARASCTSVGADPELAPVGAEHRPAHG